MGMTDHNLMPMKAVADYLGISRRKLARLVNLHGIPRYTTAADTRAVLINVHDVEKVIAPKLSPQ